MGGVVSSLGRPSPTPVTNNDASSNTQGRSSVFSKIKDIA